MGCSSAADDAGATKGAEDKYDAAPKILGTMELSYADVTALNPDLILDIRSSGDKERHDRLSQIATALGKPAEGQQMLADLQSVYAEYAEKHPEWKGKSVAVGSRTSVGWGAYTSEDGRVKFFEKLGFVQDADIARLAGDNPGWAVELSEENLDVLDADILVAFPIYIENSEIENNASWKRIPAVQDGRSLLIDDTLAQAFSVESVGAQRYALENFTPKIAAVILA